MESDLHCHTKLSDGSTTIDELIFLAKNKNVNTISVTDCDTFAGSVRAQIFGKKYGIEVIPGVEITAFDYQRNKSAHLLCYACEYPNRLEGLFKKIRDIRKKSSVIMLQKVIRMYPISPDMVLKRAQGSTNLFKAHVMHALVDAGYASSFYGNLYQKLFKKGSGLALVKSDYPEVRDVLKQIHSAGGVSVLAHPGFHENYDLLEELACLGLCGVEVWHPRNKEFSEKQIIDIAKKYNLIKVGGSDFRGMYMEKPNPIATCTTPKNQLNIIKGRVVKKKNAV
ncbi:MAG: PHP domain-containing protein [Oscillospiraceae bacterium]|jgi:predicted metal-dependent phosphoesterase TrpH|nr:PHP domain-containing protein [Oscillospiraceae bacterium]